MSRVALTLFAVLFAAIATFAYNATASADTVIESETVTNGYPQTLTFSVTAKSDRVIADVTLKYAIAGRGSSALGKPQEFTPATNVTADVVLQVNSSSSYFPVGSNFTYHWEIITADGATLIGPDQTFFYLPPNQDWQHVSNDFMTVYYHGDRESIANAYLKAGEDTYERIGKQLYGITLQQTPVNVILFADEAESSLALQGSGGRFDAAVTTCGTKVTNDIVLIIPIPCGSTDRTDTLRHEFGHILNETAGEGTLAKLPSWLDEGAAVYAQSSPGDYQTAFLAAARSNRLIPFSQMSIPATNPSQVGVFYGESWAMVSYLIDKDGPEAFAKFMRTIKGGRRFDQALSDVYGFARLDDFEAAFKKAVGVTQQGSPTARPTSATTPTPRANASATPRTSAPAATSDDSGIGTGTIVIGGVAVLFLLAAIFAFLISMMMANNRKSAVARRPGAPPATQPAPDEWKPPGGPPSSSE